MPARDDDGGAESRGSGAWRGLEGPTLRFGPRTSSLATAVHGPADGGRTNDRIFGDQRTGVGTGAYKGGGASLLPGVREGTT